HGVGQHVSFHDAMIWRGDHSCDGILATARARDNPRVRQNGATLLPQVVIPAGTRPAPPDHCTAPRRHTGATPRSFTVPKLWQPGVNLEIHERPARAVAHPPEADGTHPAPRVASPHRLELDGARDLDGARGLEQRQRLYQNATRNVIPPRMR